MSEYVNAAKISDVKSIIKVAAQDEDDFSTPHCPGEVKKANLVINGGLWMEKKEKLTYSLTVLKVVQLLKEKIEQAGLELDTRYIDYFGENCPHCGDAFKIYNREVKGVASVSAFFNMEQQKGIAYCICKKCAKAFSKPFAKMDGEGSEERIFEKIPDLKRSHKATKAEIELEKRILKKIFL